MIKKETVKQTRKGKEKRRQEKRRKEQEEEEDFPFTLLIGL